LPLTCRTLSQDTASGGTNVVDPISSTSSTSLSDEQNGPEEPGSVVLPVEAGHMSEIAYNSLPDVIDKTGLTLIPSPHGPESDKQTAGPNGSVAQFIQALASFGQKGEIGSESFAPHTFGAPEVQYLATNHQS
jgi:hypothetical protein